ncbi:MAG: glycosyltransferase [Anaerolineae bacterium]|jgi:glycosyltransferase involved in cell wall biosynthesis|nr:glycosyltransferase [Anaerolineae bacterium]
MNIVLIGSTGRCGIREYSHILMEGFRALGHHVRYIGVRRHDNRDLARCIRQVEHSDDIVIFEYEPGIFWLGGLIRAMAWLRLRRRARVLLSVHEIGPEKYPEAHLIQHYLARPLPQRGPRAIGSIFLAGVDVLLRFWTLRGGLLTTGWLPHAVLVHSQKALENIRVAVTDTRKVKYVPHVVKKLDGDRDALRQQLGLSLDRFALIIPGFLFRRKRIIEVIEQLPELAELWIVGTESDLETGYLEEIKAYLAQSDKREQVRLIHDYERMEMYLMAADAAVFYYSDGYQSGVASLAVGAGKPCIFSDLPAFSDLREAGLVVHTSQELREAMLQVQNNEVYSRLREHALELRETLAPSRVAALYFSEATDAK